MKYKVGDIICEPDTIHVYVVDIDYKQSRYHIKYYENCRDKGNWLQRDYVERVYCLHVGRQKSYIWWDEIREIINDN